MGRVTIDGLTKVFSDIESQIVAVDDLELSIEDGEFLVLVGPSGCGKSTTLRCIAGLEDVTDGDVIIDDEVMTEKKPKERDIAMVFQNYALYPHMSVRENMAFGLKMTTNLSADEIDARVDDAAEMMGIEDLLGKRPKELSGGQQQRVALGRAIVRDPAVFLMDEPLSNLDAKLRAKMRTELQNLQQELGVTTVYVTHDQTEAMTMGDRIAILNDGELQQIGTPMECYHSPANRFVASFIGEPSMNFLDVTLERTAADNGRLVGDGFTYPLSEGLLDVVPRGHERLVLGIRPEDIEPASEDDPRGISATVTVTEPLGDSTHVYLDINDAQHTAELPGSVDFDVGKEIYISFPEEYIHLFDPDTGEAILNRQAPIETTYEELLSAAPQTDVADVSE